MPHGMTFYCDMDISLHSIMRVSRITAGDPFCIAPCILCGGAWGPVFALSLACAERYHRATNTGPSVVQLRAGTSLIDAVLGLFSSWTS